MEVSELSDQEKGVMLARLSDLQEKYQSYALFMYGETTMWLAMRLAEWAWDNLPEDRLTHTRDRGGELRSYRDTFRVFWATRIRPNGEQIQRAWLDKVLVLCIEAGLVEADEAGE